MVIAMFSAAMAFVILQNFDEATVTGPSTVIRINASDNVASGPQITAMLESFAREHHVNIGREVDDLQRPENVRHVYLAVGNPEAPSSGWLKNGYPGFSRSIRTDVHPLRDISNRDPRAYYLLFGPEEHADELLRRFSDHGLHGWHKPFFTASSALRFFGDGALLWCVAVVGLVVIVVVGSGVILNTRAYGVQRLHGLSFLRILSHDLRSLAVHVLRVAAVLAPSITALLFAYNRLHQASSFAVVAAGFFGFFAAVALVVHVVSLALVHRTGVLGSVKGEVSARATMSGTYVVRIPALFLTLAAAVSLLAAGGDVVAQRSDMAVWSRTGDAAYVLLNGSLGAETSRLDRAVGGWIRRASGQGQVILSHREPPGAVLPPDRNGPGSKVLLVNSTYLAEQAVLDVAGHRLVGPRRGEHSVQVLVPSRSWRGRQEIAAGVERWVAFFAGKRPVTRPEVKVVRTKSEQSLFTYDSSASLGEDLRLRDPVVVAIPDGSDLLPDAQYTAYATQNAVIFRRSADVVAALPRDGLSEYVLGVNPVAQDAANRYRDAVRQLRLRTFNLMASLAVLAITAISVAVMYSRKNAQPLFVKYISGWSFVEAYRPILALELSASLLLVAWSVSEVRSRSAGMSIATAPSAQPELALGGWEPLAATGVAALSLAFVVTALARFNRTMVRKHSSVV